MSMKSQKVTNTDQDQPCLPPRDLLFENWFFKDSPYWTFWVHDVDGLEVQFKPSFDDSFGLKYESSLQRLEVLPGEIL